MTHKELIEEAEELIKWDKDHPDIVRYEEDTIDLIQRLTEALKERDKIEELEAEVFLNGGATKYVLQGGQLVKRHFTKEDMLLPTPPKKG